MKVNTSTKILNRADQRRSTNNLTGSETVVPDNVDADQTSALTDTDTLPPPPPPTPPPPPPALAAPSSSTGVTVVFVPYPGDCCPKTCRWKYSCWEAFVRTTGGEKWWTYRCYCKRLVDHRYFESFIIFMIMTSSVSLVISVADESLFCFFSSKVTYYIRSPDRVITFYFAAVFHVRCSTRCSRFFPRHLSPRVPAIAFYF